MGDTYTPGIFLQVLVCIQATIWVGEPNGDIYICLHLWYMWTGQCGKYYSLHLSEHFDYLPCPHGWVIRKSPSKSLHRDLQHQHAGVHTILLLDMPCTFVHHLHSLHEEHYTTTIIGTDETTMMPTLSICQDLLPGTHFSTGWMVGPFLPVPKAQAADP